MQDFLILGSDFRLDLNGVFITETNNLKKIMNEMCLSYGSSLKGRREAMEYTTGFFKKAPLVVSQKHDRYYLLTRSLKSKDCLLINYSELLLYKKINLNKTRLYFHDNIYYDINLDSRILKRQVKILKDYLKTTASLD